MISSAQAIVERGGVLRSVTSRPPLTIRQLRGAEPEVCELCLVGSAAGPLAGDQVCFELTVLSGAQARLTSTGASLAQGGGGTGRLSSHVSVADGASLHAEPPPVIACAGSSAEITLRIELASTATVCWRELLVLGRHGEPAGAVLLDWRVDRDARPVLRQQVDLRTAAALAWPGILGGPAHGGPAHGGPANRVLATALLTGPAVAARTIVDSPTAVSQKLDDNTVLVTVLDADTAAAGRRLDRLLSQLT